MAALPAFLLDGMLGHLARWLRLLGHDAAYAGSSASDEDVLDRAALEGRVLATRDRALAARAARRNVRVVVSRPGSLEEELAELLRAAEARVDSDAWLTRCTTCNGELGSAGELREEDRVPEAVRPANVVRCKTCGRAYWEGTHVASIRRTLERVRERVGSATQ